MEKIIRHIEKLLLHHDYVVVPSLGGFVIQKHSACIEQETLIAPYSSITFNALMHHSDGLLVIELSRSLRISFREAQELLEKEVQQIKSSLKNGATVGIGNIGSITLSDEGLYTFEPAANTAFLPQNTGLKNLSLSGDKAKENKKSKHVKFNAARLARYAAAFALLLGLQFGLDKADRQQSQSASVINIDLLKTVSTTPKPEKVSNDTVCKQRPDSELFHVIVASLPTLKSAEEFALKLRNDSFPETHLLSPATTYRVAIKSFDNRDEAINYMEKLRLSDSRFETAWVLCRK